MVIGLFCIIRSEGNNFVDGLRTRGLTVIWPPSEASTHDLHTLPNGAGRQEAGIYAVSGVDRHGRWTQLITLQDVF